MATIWEAEHQTLGSPVAVKFLLTRTGPEGDQLTQRFMREARSAASVRHRNVVEIIDFGVTDEGIPFIVMEMLEGESLADRLDRETTLDVPEAARIVSLTLRGLAAVHDAGIVHRDLKPENVFIATDADGTYPKLLDFGVSRQTGSTGSKDLTQEGILVGTPEYMSPEQARGLKDIDLRTDIYSMGVILYEAITGRLPYEAENVGDLIVLINTEEPVPVTEHRPNLSSDVAAIIHRALSRDREARFQDARSMRWALIEAFRDEAFGDAPSGVTSYSELPPASGSFTGPLPGNPAPRVEATSEPSHVGAPPPAPAATAPASRGRSRAGLWAVLVLLLGGGAAGGYWLYQRQATPTEAQQPPAPTPWVPVAVDGSAPMTTDAGPFHDAGATVRVTIRGIPEGGTLFVDGVPVEGNQTELPVVGFDYSVEVRGPEDTHWTVEHPGDVDGDYEVGPLEPMGDAGVSDAGATVDEQGRRRRWRRLRRRPRMR